MWSALRSLVQSGYSLTKFPTSVCVLIHSVSYLSQTLSIFFLFSFETCNKTMRREK
nr:MAG TPA: hypothetical protein [Bacteriophage sp.]